MFYSTNIRSYCLLISTLTLSVLAPLCPLSAVGRPIRVERNEKPTAEELDALHQLYMEELSNLFEEHKGNYGVDKDTHLNFV